MWTAIALIVATLALAYAVSLHIHYSALSESLRKAHEAHGVHVRWADQMLNAVDERISAVGKLASMPKLPIKRDRSGIAMVPTTWEEVEAAYANDPNNYKES